MGRVQVELVTCLDHV